MAGLHDAPRPGQPRTDDRAKVLAETLTPPPNRLGVTHSTSRLLARRLGISPTAVLDVWREHRVRPWRAETFKFSTDPELFARPSVLGSAGANAGCKVMSLVAGMTAGGSCIEDMDLFAAWGDGQSCPLGCGRRRCWHVPALVAARVLTGLAGATPLLPGIESR